MWAWKKPNAANKDEMYTRLQGDVTFDGVDFGYNPDKMVLHDIKMYATPGQKIAFVGSAVATVKKDEVMKFWGGPKIGGHINVVMNGAYVPLGQRSTVYGTVNDDGMISLDRLDSIE